MTHHVTAYRFEDCAPVLQPEEEVECGGSWTPASSSSESPWGPFGRSRPWALEWAMSSFRRVSASELRPSERPYVASEGAGRVEECPSGGLCGVFCGGP